MVTLGELLARLELRMANVTRGHSLEAPVSGVVVAGDLRGGRPLLGGEIVVTAGPARGDADAFVRTLAQRGVVGVVFAGKPGVGFEALLAACDRWRLPLMVSSSGAPSDELTEAVFAALHDEPATALVRSVRCQHELAEACSTERACRPVVAVVARELGCPVWLCRGGLVFAPVGQEPLAEHAERLLLEATGPESRLSEIPLGDDRVAEVFAVERGRPAERSNGHLVCALPRSDPMSPDQRLTVEQALVFLELALAAEETRRRERRRCANELVRRIDTSSADRDELDAWLRVLGVHARGHVICVVAEAGADDADEVAGMLEDLADWLEVDRVVARRGAEASAFLFVEDADHKATDTIQTTLPELGRRLGLDVTYGTTSVIAVDTADVVRALWDARQVRRLNGLRAPLEPGAPDERSPSVAMLLNDDGARRMLHSTVLAELLAYDERNATELVRSLDVFLSECGNWSAAAAALDVHVNTLRYRLHRVEKVTGRRLSSMSDRVDFYVALKAGVPSPGPGGTEAERRLAEDGGTPVDLAVARP